jgi:hypothetical protein
MNARSRPRYVEYGSLMTVPGPFRSLGTRLYGFWAAADPLKLASLCERVFAEPSGGTVQCRPLGRRVLLTWGFIQSVVSETPPFDQRGAVAEPQVAIWLPLAIRGPGSHPERFAMFIPYIWLDQAMSLATGREVFGYPKSWGWIDATPEHRPRTWKLDAFGLDYGEGESAARHPVLEVAARNAGGATGCELESLGALTRELARRLFHPTSPLKHLKLDLEIARDLVQERFPGVFLKQFREPGDGRLAALQQITEVTYQVVRLKAKPMLAPYELTVHDLDSHPVRQELGLESQTLDFAYEVQMDFNVQDGRVLWDSTRGG